MEINNFDFVEKLKLKAVELNLYKVQRDKEAQDQAELAQVRLVAVTRGHLAQQECIICHVLVKGDMAMHCYFSHVYHGSCLRKYNERLSGVHTARQIER